MIIAISTPKIQTASVICITNIILTSKQYKTQIRRKNGAFKIQEDQMGSNQLWNTSLNYIMGEIQVEFLPENILVSVLVKKAIRQQVNCATLVVSTVGGFSGSKLEEGLSIEFPLGQWDCIYCIYLCSNSPVTDPMHSNTWGSLIEPWLSQTAPLERLLLCVSSSIIT